MAKDSESKSFEKAMAELERIVQALESGQVPLAEALAQYEKSIALMSYCQKVLSQAEQCLPAHRASMMGRQIEQRLSQGVNGLAAGRHRACSQLVGGTDHGL